MKKPGWKSRKFWVAVVTIGVMLGNHFGGWDLSLEAVLAVVLPAVAWILGESWVDGQSAKVNQ